ncbi:hypothetical protein [Vibrio sp. D431a]|uniref:hypothetical protein n=1 Tax=Vibrio sp. D431a TaxID=2837388 RepID=UPI002556B621|nr:hypothetical protein [Vibrio sp. D431a]MDK9790070.1 hypothetical protein [Vibrio sp. D431a]
MSTNENLKDYKILLAEQQSLYRKQATHLREIEKITSIDAAVDFIEEWIPTQEFKTGVMEGMTASVMLTCAILGQAINPDSNGQISMLESDLGWSIYHELKKKGIW